ncbi:hypothetical protein V493_00830 [Pseudogymnoascus sp. VKM F-4281 (FW-2241)]|nr:hypothetical protein V493_00830 [Pseudogymnoascus sp. VKM F-4281 (FW-2241)]
MTTRALGAQRVGVKWSRGTYRVVSYYVHFRARRENTGSGAAPRWPQKSFKGGLQAVRNPRSQTSANGICARLGVFVAIEDTYLEYLEGDDIKNSNCNSSKAALNSPTNRKANGDDEADIASESDGRDYYFGGSEAIYKSDPDNHPTKTNIKILKANITLDATIGYNYKYDQSIEFIVVADPDDPAATYVKERPFTTKLYEPRGFEQAREWLWSCQGIDYLWVDSRCIMQDNYDDKNITIKDLKNIFYNATVTIIAEYAETVSDGFLADRQTSPICQLPFYCSSSGPMGSVTLMPTVKPEKDYIWPGSVRSGAKSRAWCLEEYLLSPRKLIYGEVDSRWSCQALSYKPHYPTDVNRSKNASIASWDTVSSDYKTEAQKAKRWIYIVQEYLLRNLTESEDQSRAIAGIGEKLAEMSCRRYVEKCGIFTNSQSPAESQWGGIRSWTVQGEEKGLVPGFPSWSWLSVKHDNFITFNLVCPFDSIFRVEIDSEVDGILRINAAIFPVTGLRENLHIKSDTNAPDTYQDCSLLCFNYFCHTEYSGLVVRPKREERCGRSEEQKWVRVGCFSTSDNPESSERVSVEPKDSYIDPPSSDRQGSR